MPWEYALYCYRHLQELDHRRAWVERLHAVEAGKLAALAFHDPEQLEGERRALLARASAASLLTPDEVRARAARMARDIATGGVLLS